MLRKFLETLPTTLDQTYDRILSAIHRDDSPYAIRILQWLTFSARPLSVEELAEVVAIDVARDPTFERDEVLEDPLDVLAICSSLLVVTTHKAVKFYEHTRQVVAFAHYSVKEYLLSERIFTGPAARYGMRFAECHQTIAEGCIGYLLQNYDVNESLFVHAPKFKLTLYSANFWIHHALAVECKTKAISKRLLNLLSKENDAYRYWLWIYNPDSPHHTEAIHSYPPYLPPPAPLYYTSLCGMAEASRLLLERKDDVNAQGGCYGNALQAAAQGGYEKIVELLLDAGADVNTQGGHHGSALQAASAGGHEQIVKLLLGAGADTNVHAGHYTSVSYTVSSTGYEEVHGGCDSISVDDEYDDGAFYEPNSDDEIDRQDEGYSNALYAASVGGHENIVVILLNAGARVNAQGGLYGNALQAAAQGGYENIVKLLLDAGADIHAQGGMYGNALQAATERGYEEIAKLLLDAGADINTQGEPFENVLKCYFYALPEGRAAA
jgi:ankyrin repeat protein